MVTCDSIVDVFSDGKHYITHNNYKTIGYVDIPGYTKVLAIKVFIDDMDIIISHFGKNHLVSKQIVIKIDNHWSFQCESLGVQGGILAKFDNGIISDDSWDCFTEKDSTHGLVGNEFSTLQFDASLVTI